MKPTTRSLLVDYARPAIGEVVIARAQVTDHSAGNARCRAEIVVEAGDVTETCAVAQGTVARRRE